MDRSGTAARRFGRRPFIASLAGFIALACGPATPTSQAPRSASSTLMPPTDESPFTVVLPASDLAIGEHHRFLVALIDERNRPIADAEVGLRFFKIEGSQAVLKSQSVARYYGTGLGDRGVYVTRTTFDLAGPWGVEVAARRDGQELGIARVSFQVQERSRTPAVGAEVPRSVVPTGTTPAEIETFCSARPVDDFHRLSIDQAVAAGQPFLLLFASPGFCQTQTCGPSLEVLQGLRERFGSRFNYLHVEVYQDPHLGAPGLKPVPAVQEWKLPSEPWLFCINANGTLADKFEGGITLEETAPAVEAWLGASA